MRAGSPAPRFPAEVWRMAAHGLRVLQRRTGVGGAARGMKRYPGNAVRDNAL